MTPKQKDTMKDALLMAHKLTGKKDLLAQSYIRNALDILDEADRKKAEPETKRKRRALGWDPLRGESE